jgi:hypothetical protein
MAAVFAPLRYIAWLIALGLAMLVLAPGSASADFQLQIGSDKSTGLDPVRIGGDGLVTVTSISNGAPTLNTTWDLFLGIPNVTSTLAEITKVNNTNNVVIPTFDNTLVSGQDAYARLGLSGTNNSNKFSDWAAADLKYASVTATSFGLFDLKIPFNVAPKGTISFDFQFLPAGTFVIAYGTALDKNGKTVTFDTPFTEAGLTTANGPPLGPSPTPEPSTLAIAGLGALGFVGYRLRRRTPK